MADRQQIWGKTQSVPFLSAALLPTSKHYRKTVEGNENKVVKTGRLSRRANFILFPQPHTQGNRKNLFLNFKPS